MAPAIDVSRAPCADTDKISNPGIISERPRAWLCMRQDVETAPALPASSLGTSRSAYVVGPLCLMDGDALMGKSCTHLISLALGTDGVRECAWGDRAPLGLSRPRQPNTSHGKLHGRSSVAPCHPYTSLMRPSRPPGPLRRPQRRSPRLLRHSAGMAEGEAAGEAAGEAPSRSRPAGQRSRQHVHSRLQALQARTPGGRAVWVWAGRMAAGGRVAAVAREVLVREVLAREAVACSATLRQAGCGCGRGSAASSSRRCSAARLRRPRRHPPPCLR